MPAPDDRVRARLERLETEARQRPRLHAARLAVVIGLGYLYPALLLVVTLGAIVATLAFASAMLGFEGGDLLLGLLLLAELAAATLVLLAFRTRIPPPAGHVLKPEDAPALRRLVDDVADRAGVPRVDRIHLDESLNAGVLQVRPHAFWGASRSYLVLGVPLLMALTPGELAAIVAHELGHLRGAHSRLSGWAYRVHATWRTIGAALAKSKPLQRLAIGWFAERYGDYLARSTLAVRRVHEYDADAFAAANFGAEPVGAVLCRLDFMGYRLQRQFWPGIARLAGVDPVPPSDIFARMSDFLQTAAEEDPLRRWLARERRTRTPITSVHPSLADRLAGLNASDLLQGDRVRRITSAPCSAVTESSLALLGPDGDRYVRAVTALWKIAMMDRWRLEHRYARYLTEPHSRRRSQSEEPADVAWRDLEPTALFAPADVAQPALAAFLAEHPQYARANLAMGLLLLEHDHADGLVYLERAADGDLTTARRALTCLLDYHRDLGADAPAGAAAQRLRELDRRNLQVQRAVAAVSRRERFEAPRLAPAQQDEVRRVLFRYARIRAAYLAARAALDAEGKPTHVLLLKCRSGRVARSAQFIEALRGELPISCAVVIAAWSNLRLQRRIRRAAPEPVFAAGD